MMKQGLYIIGLLLVFGSCQSKKNKLDPEICDGLRYGRYFMDDMENDVSYKIERIENIQVEINNVTQDTVTYNVRWTGDCWYYLTLRSGPGWMAETWQNNELAIEIIDITPDEYTYKAKFARGDLVTTNKMLRIY